MNIKQTCWAVVTHAFNSKTHKADTYRALNFRSVWSTGITIINMYQSIIGASNFIKMYY